MMELVTVGKIKDSHGLKGELFVALFAGEAPWLPEIKKFTLEYKSPNKEDHTLHREFVIRSVRPHKKGLIIQTEEITDRTQADKYIGAVFQIPKKLTVSRAGENIFLGEIEGFTVQDEDLGNIGVITAFSSNGVQDLLIVTSEEDEYQIPLVKDFLIEIVWHEKKLLMKLPDGILEQK